MYTHTQEKKRFAVVICIVFVCVEEERGGSESSEVDLRELLSEVRRLRLQLERSIQTNTALRHKLEQQLLTQTDPPSTININYLLPQAGIQTQIHICN